VILDESPTAESLAKILFLKAYELGLNVSRITFWEGPDSFAIYEETENSR